MVAPKTYVKEVDELLNGKCYGAHECYQLKDERKKGCLYLITISFVYL